MSKFIKKVMNLNRTPEVIVTGCLNAYPTTLRQFRALGKQMKGRRLTNRAENSNLSLRQQQSAILRFRQKKALQKFTSVHNPFHQDRHPNNRQDDNALRSAALAEWKLLMA